jgi:predicted DNA-binding WGR domain protein
MKKFCYLICVEGDNNHNKYYEMSENDNQTFTVKFGRVGSKASLKIYNIYQWDSKYNEKIRKGYTDVTHLKTTELKKSSSGFLEIFQRACAASYFYLLL